MKTFLKFIGVCVALHTSFAAIKTETVEYKEGDTTLEGVLIYDDSIVNKRPGILIAHQWKGLTDYEKKRGEMLAKLGYVAFAADIYGKGTRPKDVQEAGEFAGRYRSEERRVGKECRSRWLKYD